ncbi:MAG: hypothetical protein ACRDHL_05260 [Candidatus Promineifilaceae bacterium]
MSKSQRLILGLIALLAGWLLAGAGAALAHESRPVGEFEFVVGFRQEPAFEGQPNGVELHIRVPAGEGEEPTPVEGAAETLQVEVTHLDSGVAQVMGLRAVFGEPGRYTNDWIPTAPGAYRFHFTGQVGDLAVDEVFESSEETFGSVQPADDLYFPEPVAQPRELESAVRGAQETAAEALAAGEAAQSRGNLALAAGAAGLLLGAAALVVGLRRKAA